MKVYYKNFILSNNVKIKSILIISDSSKRVGLGHYSRSKYLTHELKGFLKKNKNNKYFMSE